MSIYIIEEGEEGFCSIQKATASDPKIHTLIGVGLGSQYYTADDPTYKGIRIIEKYEVEDGFKDTDGNMADSVTKKWESRQIDHRYTIETTRKMVIEPGDSVEFRPMDSAPESLSISSIEDESSGLTRLEMGAPKMDLTTVEEARSGISSEYTVGYLKESHVSKTGSCTFYVQDPAHVTAPNGSIDIAIPPGVLAEDLNPRITLSLSLSLSDIITGWSSGGVTYYVGDMVYWEADDGITYIYRCKSEHTSSGVSEPDESGGASYWDNIGGVIDIELGRCAWRVEVEDTKVSFGAISASSIGSSISIAEMDITDLVTAGEDATIEISCRLKDEYPVSHTRYEAHPQISANATVKFYKRST